MKAQGLSISTIIIAAIALVVLVVIVAVFTGRMSIFGIELSNTQKGTLCPGNMIQAVSCPEGKVQDYNNFRQCLEDESPEIGCSKAGYICCR